MSFCTGALLSLLPFCAPTHPGPLTYRPKVGETHRSHVVYDMFLGSAEAKIELDSTDTVVGIAPNGNVSIQEIQSNSYLVTGGKRSSVPSSQPTVQVFRPDNTRVPVKVATNDTRVDFRIENLHNVKLPPSPMVTGKTWTWQTKADAATGQTNMRATYKVLGSENVAGAECWKISVVSHELDGKAPASTVGTVWMLKSNATSVEEKFSFKNFPAPGATGVISGTTTVTPIA